jgi:hypothetical protein
LSSQCKHGGGGGGATRRRSALRTTVSIDTGLLFSCSWFLFFPLFSFYFFPALISSSLWWWGNVGEGSEHSAIRVLPLRFSFRFSVDLVSW